jgi:hypothetical protein
LPNGQAGAALWGIEQSDDRIRQARELTERCNHLPTWEISGFAETYLRGELNIGLWCRTLGEQANCGFICSCAHPASGDGNKGIDGTPPTGHHECSRANLGRQKPFMFSHNVEIVESAEQMVPILSSVRFQRFDDSSFFGGERLYEFVAFVSLPGEEDCFIGGDGKVSIINKRLAVAVRQSGSENVKTASNCVEVDPGFDLESERERLFFCDHHPIIGNVRWQLSDRYMNIIAEPSIKPLLKKWEVGFGPIDRGLGGVRVVTSRARARVSAWRATSHSRPRATSRSRRPGQRDRALHPHSMARGLSTSRAVRLVPSLSFQASLRGRWRGNCHPGELGLALRKLGFARQRRWQDGSGFRALWYPTRKSIKALHDSALGGV